MDRLQSLMDALRRLVADPSLELHDALRGAEKAIDNHLDRMDRTAKQSELRQIREAIQAEKAKRRLGDSDFWTSVEDYIDQLKPKSE